MAPPEFSQGLEAEAPVLPVSLDVEDSAAVHGPHKQIAPVSIQDVHQTLHLSIRRGSVMQAWRTMAAHASREACLIMTLSVYPLAILISCAKCVSPW